MLGGHDRRTDDLSRFAGLGLSALRYPLLWEAFANASDREALWAWHDVRLGQLQAWGVRPIVGLIHHGSGPRGTDLLASSFASGLAAHAREAAERYPWVRDWTPVNEPLTTARFSALYAHWYPHQRDERSFWLALLNQGDAIRLAMAAIRLANPEARLIQTEDIGRTDATAERQDQADFDNLRRWASWDLLTGRIDAQHMLHARLANMGFEDRLSSFVDDPCPPDVLGLNHYLTSDRFLDHRIDRYPAKARGSCSFGPLADVETVRALGCSPGLEGALRDTWERYRLPMAVTEVHNGCTREEQMRWLGEAWSTATRLRAEGQAIEAVTAWSLLGAHDWDSLLTRSAGHYESGVFDIRGTAPRETALAPMIRKLAAGGTPDHPVLANAGWWRNQPGPLSAEAKTSSDGEAITRPLLIAGASGTLGQAFAGACRLRGIDYILTARETMDLTDPRSMALALDALAPWAVVNCAGWVRVDEAESQSAACLAVNFAGSVALARACAERDIHYTCFSSDLVFDGKAGRAYVESDPPAPLGIYGVSKASADSAIARARRRALVIRTASFFSPFDEYNFAVHLAAALREGRSFVAASDCVTSPTFVPDLVRATLDLIIDDERGLWHLVSDGALSWSDFAFEIAAALALPSATIEPRTAEAMGWTAARPRFAPLTSERGLIMPALSCAVERFAREVGEVALSLPIESASGRAGAEVRAVDGSDNAERGNLIARALPDVAA